MNKEITNCKRNGSTNMSSLEIAKMTGKRHADVMRDIRCVGFKIGYSSTEIELMHNYYSVPDQTLKYKYYEISGVLLDALLTRYNFGAKSHGEREHAALCTIEQLLGVKLQRQYAVGDYRVDGYCVETNTVYEIDEDGHKNGSYKVNDISRQRYIERKLGCKFVRIDVSKNQ